MDFRRLIDIAADYAVLVEGKQVGVLYHFTSAHTVFSILDDDALKSKKGGGISFNGEAFVIDRFRDWVSLTRNHNLMATAAAGGHGREWNVIRMAFDGDRLSHNLKIQPYHDDDGRLARSDGQAEERIMGGAQKIKRALLQIDFLADRFIETETAFDQWASPPDEEKRQAYIEQAHQDAETIYQMLRQEGVPVNVVKNFQTPVRLIR